MEEENKLNDAVINALSLLKRVHRLNGTVAILDGTLIHADISQMKAFSSERFAVAVNSIFDGFARRQRRAERVALIYGGSNLVLISGGPMVVGFFFDKLTDLETVENGIDRFIEQFKGALRMDEPALELPAEVPATPKKPQIVTQLPPVQTRSLPKVKVSDPVAITGVVEEDMPVVEPSVQEQSNSSHQWLVAAVCSLAGFFSIGAAFFFRNDSNALALDSLGFWSGAATAEDLALIGWWAFFAAVMSVIPITAAGERLKTTGIAIFSCLNGAVTVPIIARWIAPGGWLAELDFAGSNGGALLAIGIGMIALSLRLATTDVERREESSFPTLNSAVISALGLIGLYFWSGPFFLINPVYIAMGGVAAGVVGIFLPRITNSRQTPASYAFTILGGAVAVITAGGQLSPLHSLIAGSVAGGLVSLWHRPSRSSGIIPAFLVCGIWGSLYAGLISAAPWKSQLIGVSAIAMTIGATAFCLFRVLKISKLLNEPDLEAEES